MYYTFRLDGALYATYSQPIMETFADIFAAFGGPARFADAIGIKDFHAQTMRQRGSIPPAYWADTVKAASERNIEGVTLERLAEIAKAKRAEAERVA